jgi:hypothetical protein
MRATWIAAGVAAAIASGGALAKLPAPTDEQKAKAAEAKAKADWTAKMDAYQLCLSQDRAAAAYQAGMKARDKPTTQPVATTACADPGPFQAPASK